MRRWALAPLSLAALAIGSATPILTAQAPPTPTIELSAHGNAVRDRVDAAVRLAMASYEEWLGPPPFGRLAIRDSGTDGVVLRLPLWDSPGTMRIESQVASGIARAWLSRVSASDTWKDGAASYLQSRVVEQLFDRTYLLKGYRHDAACFFGCHVPWSFRSLPISRWAAVSDPVAIAFASLERELGWPTLQGALRAAASDGAADAVAAMSDATGRDLAPVFAAASSPEPVDHAIAGLSSSPGACASPCYRSVVSIAANGAVPLPLIVRVSFADGQSVESRWDGRRDHIVFESGSPAIAARLDPDRVWLLDRNPLNNARVEPRQTNVPVAKWMARWIVWLQDAMLTHTFPV